VTIDRRPDYPDHVPYGYEGDIVTLPIGCNYRLAAIVHPSNATDKRVTWKSSDPTVATISEGMLTTVDEGYATITVTTVDGKKTTTCEVGVFEDTIE